MKTRLRFVMAVLCLGLVSLGVSSGFSGQARAGVYDTYTEPDHYDPLNCLGTVPGCCAAANIPSLIHEMFTGTGLYSGQQDLQNYYYLNSLWPKIEEALQQLSDEFSNSNVFGIGPRGAFMDAQTFDLSLISLEKQSSQSLVTQTSSDQICRFGTLSRSLAQSDDKARTVQLGLANQMLQREVMRKNLGSAFEGSVGSKLGRTSDKLGRFDQYKNTYCDPKDSNGGVGTTWCTATTDTRRNRDVDVTRTLFDPLTLKLDFSPSGVAAKTDDEQNVFSLSNNLYAHDLPVNFSQADFQAILKDNGEVSDSRKVQLADYRSLVAKRSVAQNSFAALAAMKAEGSPESAAYVKKMIEYLGVSAAADQTAYIGTNPSYNAQMELLTRKLYQSPEFYSNLMESPANVARQQTAMEGIGLMQDRDIYESLKRSEMVLSTLLEMYVMEDQDIAKDKAAK